MTRVETVKLLAILKAAYPSALRNMSVESGKALLELWALELKPFPQEAATRAMNDLIRTSKYMPTIAEMLEQVRRVGLDMLAEAACDMALGRAVPLERRKAVYGITENAEFGMRNSESWEGDRAAGTGIAATCHSEEAQATRRLQIEIGKL